MFVKPIHMIWKLTVEKAAPEKKKWFFQSAKPERIVLHFKTKQEAEQYHREKCNQAEMNIQQVRAIENQGKWWTMQDCHLKNGDTIFSYEVKAELKKPHKNERLIGVKEEVEKYYVAYYGMRKRLALYPVDFSADATYFIRAQPKVPLSNKSYRHPLVKLDPVPFMLTTNEIDAALVAVVQQPPPPAPSAPSMHALGMKNN